MAGWVLDTNVVSALRRPDRNPKGIVWHQAQVPTTLFLSVVTIVEIRLGIEGLAAGGRRAALEVWLRDEVRGAFERRILDADEAVLLALRRRVMAGRRVGQTPSEADGIIASTASVHGLGVATRNGKDFGFDIPVVNPWGAV